MNLRFLHYTIFNCFLNIYSNAQLSFKEEMYCTIADVFTLYMTKFRNISSFPNQTLRRNYFIFASLFEEVRITLTTAKTIRIVYFTAKEVRIMNNLGEYYSK